MVYHGLTGFVAFYISSHEQTQYLLFSYIVGSFYFYWICFPDYFEFIKIVERVGNGGGGYFNLSLYVGSSPESTVHPKKYQDPQKFKHPKTILTF